MNLVLARRKYRAGYEVRTELHKTDFTAVPLTDGATEKEMADYINSHQGEHVIVKSAYTPSGCYIGNSKMAHRLIVKRGIKPELRTTNHTVCSIGFCEREQKWYGWSHRAIFGFGVGSIVKEGDCTASSGWIDEYLAEHPEVDLSLPIGFEAKNLDDAKRMAIAFADSVS